MIGILGGTFDPVHYGHLRPAHEAAQQLALAQVRLMVAANPPHRPAAAATAVHRLRMIELAATEFPGFIADAREIDRGGLSYTVTTLESLRAELGARPLCLILGSDAFAGIESWHQWRRLPELAHLAVLRRPGAPADAASLPEWARARLVDTRDLAARGAGGLALLDVTPHEISATEIRARVARGERPPADWLPAAVWEYIERQRLYRGRAV